METQNKCCSKCHIEKTLDMFYKRVDGALGVRAECKECFNSKSQTPEAKSKKLLRIEKDLKMGINIKVCSICHIEKSLDMFYKSKNQSLGVKCECKECNKLKSQTPEFLEKRRAYRAQPEVRERENKQWRDNYQKPEVAQKYQEYRDKPETKERLENWRNLPEVKVKLKEKYEKTKPERNAKIRKKYNTDEKYRLIQILRSKIHKILNGISTSYENILGCDLEFIRLWLEIRFDDNMTWDNLGYCWEIDHILPISKFNFDNENDKNICFHWTNLQPLTKEENRNKRAQIQLHHYFNNIINVNRFNSVYKEFLGYEAINESLLWLGKMKPK